MGAHHKPLTARKLRNYWRNIDKQDNGCWIWTGGVNPCGTGHMGVTIEGVLLTSAHRLGWYLAHNQLLDRRTIIIHTCNNKLCQNPAHMTLDTYENRLSLNWIDAQPEPDKVKHNRTAMTPEEAQRIRDLRFKENRTLMEIVKITGRTYKTVSYIVNNKTHNGVRKGPKPHSKRKK